eukprot:gene3039-2021_t
MANSSQPSMQNSQIQALSPPELIKSENYQINIQKHNHSLNVLIVGITTISYTSMTSQRYHHIRETPITTLQIRYNHKHWQFHSSRSAPSSKHFHAANHPQKPKPKLKQCPNSPQSIHLHACLKSKAPEGH